MAQTLCAGLSEQDAGLFTLASVEVFTNIVRHAKGLLAGAQVELIADCASTEFVLEVIHSGHAFNPLYKAGVTNSDALSDGGLGMTIIRRACDRVEYLHHKGVSTVRMKSAFRAQASTRSKR
jgi:anti-sigma regulatory factor (Ser/Thr protein kinase)